MSIAWIIIVAAVLIGLQSWVYRSFGQRGVSYRRYFGVKHCYQGETIEMIERIVNRKLLPLPWLRLESLLDGSLKFQRQQGHSIAEGEKLQNHRSMFSLMSYTQVVRRHRLTCTRRGFYHLNSATLTIGDLIGFQSISKKMNFEADLLVYPRPATPQELMLPNHSWQGDFSVRRWIVEDPFMTTGVREYRFGDSLKGVNWKATARSGKLQVNQLDFTADQRLMVYLNIEDHEHMWNQISDRDLIEKGISFAAGVIQIAINRGMEAGFATNAYLLEGEKIPLRIASRGGHDHWEHILGNMAKMSVMRCVSFDTFLEQECSNKVSNMDIVIISTYMNDKLFQLVEQLRRDGNAVDILPLQPDAKHEGEVAV